jgi:hypothetical protein
VLESLEADELSDAERVLVARAWDRQLAACSAESMAAKVAATVAQRDAIDYDAELALAMRRTDFELSHELHDARRAMAMPVTFALLRTGATTLRHIRALLEVSKELDDEDARELDDAVGHRAATMTASAFKRVARKLAVKLDRRTPEQKAAARKAKVGVKTYPQPDGLTTAAVTLPADRGLELLRELNRRAEESKTDDDQRTHGERQVDALMDALLGQPSAAGSVATKRRADVHVVIDWATLIGLRDNPGELRGYGPIDADTVRAMLRQDGTVLRRIVTSPLDGTLVDYSVETWRPDAHLRGIIAARDITCRYPGCTRNAEWCDDEHCQTFASGGQTSTGNCCAMCRTHHRRKTFDGFGYTRPDPANGETRWTTPLGFTYTQRPAYYDDTGPDTGNTLGGTDPPVAA